MKNWLFTSIWGIFVWFFATFFFVQFGDQVLFSPGSDKFLFSLAALLAGTAVLLWAVTYLYCLFDKSENAALKFGVIGSIIGLALDTFSLANHEFLFQKLNESQVIAFSAWMSFAYALYLLIPLLMNQFRKKHRVSVLK